MSIEPIKHLTRKDAFNFHYAAAANNPLSLGMMLVAPVFSKPRIFMATDYFSEIATKANVMADHGGSKVEGFVGGGILSCVFRTSADKENFLHHFSSYKSQDNHTFIVQVQQKNAFWHQAVTAWQKNRPGIKMTSNAYQSPKNTTDYTFTDLKDAKAFVQEIEHGTFDAASLPFSEKRWQWQWDKFVIGSTQP